MSNFFKSFSQKIRDKVVELLPCLVEKALEALHSLVDKAAAAAKSGLSGLGDQVKIALKPQPPVAPEETLTSLEMNAAETLSESSAGAQVLPNKLQPLTTDFNHKLAAYTADQGTTSTPLNLAYLDLAHNLTKPLPRVAVAA